MSKIIRLLANQNSGFNLEIVKIDKPNEINFIFGQGHFIKTVEDLHEVIVQSVPNIKFGIAFCESSGPRLIRTSGNDKTMVNLAVKNAKKVSCGHTFFIFLKNAYPINILNAIKNISEVCRIFCATANPTEVIIAQSDMGRGVVGVIDGQSPLGIEKAKDKKERGKFLRKIGYKL